MACSERKEDDVCFLQPQLFSKQRLIELLELRSITLRNLPSLNKDDLVEIFIRVAVPLPQRIYKPSRRGKLLNESRTRLEKIREQKRPAEERPFGFSESTNFPADRLKPPPVNLKRKKINLSVIKSPTCGMDNIQIKRRKSSDELKSISNSPTSSNIRNDGPLSKAAAPSVTVTKDVTNRDYACPLIESKMKNQKNEENQSIGFKESSRSGDRLKPPPDPINFERKKIKLCRINSSTSLDLDKIQIKRRKKGETNIDMNEEIHRKQTVCSDGLQSNANSHTNSNIGNDRPLNNADEKPDSSSGNESVVKKERKKITWP